jgi:hypothetical protein
MPRQQRIYTLYGTSQEKSHLWTTFFYADGIEVRDVPVRELNIASAADLGDLVRAANTYATKQKFVGAIPTFHQSGSDYDRKYRIILFSDKVAEHAMVPASELHNPEEHHYGVMFGNFTNHSWHKRQYVSFPTFHWQGDGKARQYGSVQIKRRIGVHTRVDLAGLNGVMPEDFAAVMRGVNDLAVRLGYAAALQTGWTNHADAEIAYRFNNDYGLRNMIEKEGWRVAQITPLNSAVDGKGVVQFAAIVLLEKDE